jgi:Saxitoxin biosynthesis operon protein SxtJ
VDGRERLAHGIPDRLSPSEGRRFGLAVGAAFLALAALLYWRELPTGAVATGFLGAALLLGGLVIPGHLGPVYKAWMRFALLLSRVTTPIFLGIVYYLVFTPIGLVMRALGRNPLVRASGQGRWIVRGGETDRRGDMRRQF